MQVHKCQTDSTHNQTNRTPDVIMILHEHLSKSVRKKHKDPRSAGNNNRNPTTEGPFNYQKNVLMMFPPVFFGHVFKMDMFREWNPGEKSTKPLKRFVYGEKSTKPPPWVSPAVVARNPAVVGILQWRSEISQPSSDATRFFSPFLSSESRKVDRNVGFPHGLCITGGYRSQNMVPFFFLGGGGAKLWYRNS